MEKKFFGYKVVVASCILGLVNQGSFSVLSIFMSDIADSLGIPVGTIMYAVTAATIASALCCLFLGKIADRSKLCLIIAALSLSANFLITAYAHSAALIFIAALGMGITIGFGTTVTLSVLINNWFIEKRSRMLGFILGFAFFGDVVMMFISSRLQALIHDWRMCYTIMGILVLAVDLLCIFFFIRTPEQMGQKPLGWENSAPDAETDSDRYDTDIPDKTAPHIIRSVAFICMFLAAFLVMVSAESVCSYGATYYMENGLDALTASNVAMVYMFFAFIGSIVAGWIDEKFGHKIFSAMLLIIFTAGLILLTCWPGTGSTILVYIAVTLAGFGATAATQLCPTISLDIFGRNAYNTVCSFLVGASYLGSAASAVVMNICINATGSMKAEYGICTIMVILSLVLVFVSFLTAPVRQKN